MNALHTVRDEFDPILQQCKALVCPAKDKEIRRVQPAELTDLERMALMRILNRMESDGWQEVRDGPMVKVTRVSPSTCSLFPLLPRENATGNWVKVVQRVLVRLQLIDVDAGFLLQAGVSVDLPVHDLTAVPEPACSLYLSMEQIAGADIC